MKRTIIQYSIFTVLAIGACLVVFLFWKSANEQGGIETLFSGWAFVMLIITVLLQGRELEETREVLKRSALAQEKAEKALSDQITSMNNSALVNGYSSMIDYYDRQGRTTGPERDQSKHALQRLKEIVDNVEAAQYGSVPARPNEWRHL